MPLFLSAAASSSSSCFFFKCLFSFGRRRLAAVCEMEFLSGVIKFLARIFACHAHTTGPTEKVGEAESSLLLNSKFVSLLLTLKVISGNALLLCLVFIDLDTK